jgi:signal transduction histidine kinase
VSVKSKLLLAFAGFLTAITLLNTGLTSYLIDRQGEAEAFHRLSQQLIQLQDDLQGVREALVAVAQEAASDEKNLSDLAILYSQELALDKDPDTLRLRASSLHKAVSLNRLRLILGSARLSSLAVYLEGELSHYVTPDEAGMSARRGPRRTIVSAAQKWNERSGLDNPHGWSEHPLPVLVARRISGVERVTVAFEFPADQLMVLRVVVPIQGVTRESFTETIAESLAIARRETLHPPDAGAAAPTVIGLFVFSKAFDASFLNETAGTTGVLPAVLSPDGRHRLELVDMGVPAEFLSARDDLRMRLQTADIGDASYYQALKRWRMEGEPALILGGALSRAGTLASIRQTILLVTGAAGLILLFGIALGSVWISRMVTPIKALTAAAASMKVDASHGALERYLERPIRPQSADEIGELTSAFNAMAGQLHELIGNLRRSHTQLEALHAQRQRAEAEVRALNTTLEQQVRARTSQLEAANNELESFSYSVSHDLRAPLRGLDGFSRALLEDYDSVLDGTGRDYLRRIRAASQHMGHLIDDMLNLAHVSRGGMQRLPVDLTALACAVVEDLRNSDPARHADVIIAPHLTATGDPRLLQLLLQNLLHNAWKFTGTRPTARIECGQTQYDGVHAFFVRDDGVGFDMAYADKLFGAFQRLHTTAEFPGTGIGLATVQRIVHRHGGRVWAESQPGHGATFYFTLPDETPGAA